MYEQGHIKSGTYQSPDSDTIDLYAILTAVLRGKYILLLGALIGVSVGIANVVNTTPIYSASVNLRISSPEAEDARAMSGVSTTSFADAQITTELQVIRSEKIAERVVDELNLTENTIFFTAPQTGTSQVIGFVFQQINTAVSYVKDQLRAALGEPQTIVELPLEQPSQVDLDEQRRRIAVAILRGNMSVNQIEGSRVLAIQYRSISPELAARVANAIADAYIDDQIASKYDATQRAAEWLKERADQLRAQSIRLDRQIETFRRDNDLLDVGGDISSNTTLESLNQRVADARASVVELEARSRRLDEIVAEQDTTAVVGSTASQAITSNLRSRYLETLRAYNSLLTQLGSDHEQTERRRRELDELQSLMFEEVKRTAKVVLGDLQLERERLTRLEEAQAAAELRFSADNQTLVQLRELERNAETVRTLYTSFLQRYQQSLQQQSFPVSEARVLNRARPSGRPSFPNTQRTVTFAGLVGLMLAAGLVFIREIRDNKLRSEEQVRSALGLDYLGELPKLRRKRSISDPRRDRKSDMGPRDVLLPEIMRYASDNPFSGFAETLRAGHMSVKMRHGKLGRGPIIGVVSAYTGDGKTTVAANFATLCADQGKSAMLIDGDLRNPGLSRALGGHLERGLVEVLMDGADWQDIYYTEFDSGVHILGNRRERVPHTNETIGSTAMETLLDALSARYDYVILDLPPLGPVVDARAILHKLDGVFFVAKWGALKIKPLQKILRTEPRLLSKSYGTFLNMFNARKAKAYGIHQDAYYDPVGYQRYHDDR